MQCINNIFRQMNDTYLTNIHGICTISLRKTKSSHPSYLLLEIRYSKPPACGVTRASHHHLAPASFPWMIPLTQVPRCVLEGLHDGHCCRSLHAKDSMSQKVGRKIEGMLQDETAAGAELNQTLQHTHARGSPCLPWFLSVTIDYEDDDDHHHHNKNNYPWLW